MNSQAFDVEVIPVTEKTLPAFFYPHTVDGIESEAQALAWGQENIHPIVYFLADAQKAYAERCICDMAGDNGSCRVHHPGGRR